MFLAVINPTIVPWGALAYTTLTQTWIMVYIVSLQRVQSPTNLDVRRLNALTRKLQQSPQTLVFPAMKCLATVDLHSDSGYRRMTGEEDDEIKEDISIHFFIFHDLLTSLLLQPKKRW